MSGTADRSRELRAFAPALVLLAICALINYVDRGNLSIAAPLLKDELRISVTQLGILLSAFFWTYTAMQFVSGWLVDSLDANRMIALGFLLWSLTTAATGLVRGFTMLLAMRLMLGVGESVMIPACSKILGLHLPEHHRGFANGVLQGAWSFGPAVGTLGAGLLMARFGWRPVFIGIGLTSLAWIPAWIKWMPRAGAMARSLIAVPGFADILRQRSFWGVCAGHFSVNYLAYFMLTLLPFYLVRERHLSMQSMAEVASAYYAIEGLSAITTGWFSDFFIRRNYTPTLVRKSAMVIGHTIAAIALAGLRHGHFSLVPVVFGRSRYRLRNRSCRTIRIFPDPRRPACNRKMDGAAKRFRKSLGCRSPCAHRISCGSDRNVSGSTCDRCCGVAGWRSRVGVCGWASRTSELKVRTAHCTRSGLQHLAMQLNAAPAVRHLLRAADASIVGLLSANKK